MNSTGEQNLLNMLKKKRIFEGTKSAKQTKREYPREILDSDPVFLEGRNWIRFFWSVGNVISFLQGWIKIGFDGLRSA